MGKSGTWWGNILNRNSRSLYRTGGPSCPDVDGTSMAAGGNLRGADPHAEPAVASRAIAYEISGASLLRKQESSA